jgi:hypothetical protein
LEFAFHRNEPDPVCPRIQAFHTFEGCHFWSFFPVWNFPRAVDQPSSRCGMGFADRLFCNPGDVSGCRKTFRQDPAFPELGALNLGLVRAAASLAPAFPQDVSRQGDPPSFQFMNLNSLTHVFDLALWLAALAHFCILGASFQVPGRLRWREELPRLSSLNRKLMWTYGGFTVFAIISFGTLTFFLHDEMLWGERAAIGLALYIGLFWGLRLVVDLFYFSHTDWPRGRGLRAGHFLLRFAFVCLTSTYLGLVLMHILR